MKSYLQWSIVTIAIVIFSACDSHISISDGNTTLHYPNIESGDTNNTAKENTNAPRTILCRVRYKGIMYGCAASETGRIWLDRNLGASRVAALPSDAASYGYYFQWGRPADGHQLVSPDKRHQRATTVHPSFGEFITVNNTTTDWVVDGVDSNGTQREAFLWKTDGTGICPKGFRVPTAEELLNEFFQPHFKSTLNFPLAGFRNNDKNDIEISESANDTFWDPAGYYMASDKSSNGVAKVLFLNQNKGKISTKGRAYGYSVRCIKRESWEVAPAVPSPSENATGTDGNGASGGSTSDGNTTDSNSTSSVSIMHHGFVYKPILSQSGRTWLDRNLGAIDVLESPSDQASYGYYFQWGRPKDGHQFSYSDKVNLQAETITPPHDKFITVNSSATDWVVASVEGIDVDSDGTKRERFLSKIDGTGICPLNYRIPTAEELRNEYLLETITTESNSILKFPLAGIRNSVDGNITEDANTISAENAVGYYLTSESALNGQVKIFFLNQSMGKIIKKDRAYGYSARCIKALPGEEAL
ncbi:MAG: fibrobacter succinogenes major paralogous domain-containing protein [Sulfurovum sp.]|nr:fibrobacter succinogenes major paralogous domain-containing protein [Sulfurovum sp.]